MKYAYGGPQLLSLAAHTLVQKVCNFMLGRASYCLLQVTNVIYNEALAVTFVVIFCGLLITFCLPQILTSTAVKKGSLSTSDLAAKYKYKNILIDVKVDTESNVGCSFFITVPFEVWSKESELTQKFNLMLILVLADFLYLHFH